MLTFIGLGLFDENDVSVKGLERIRRADHVFLECYTSVLTGTTIERMEEFFGKEVKTLGRDDVEGHPEDFLGLAKDSDVAFLTAGDPMVSTTHIDLRIRAAGMGVRTEIIHGASIVSAVCGLTGLQNYRFGKSCSLPFPYGKWAPKTPIEVIEHNMAENLHTLVYLDIQPDRYMRVPEAVALLEEMAAERGLSVPVYVGVARAGSAEPMVAAGTAGDLATVDFGGPLHILVVPADLHHMEREYLETFAGL
ncbi:diphthine synthase [Methanofollis formosanus]|uniref:Diphthine synthase n=1 Tax=Methanofollis formosanus TaxID=299308 RepID=A0A8G1A3F2_9EURY|nr:diphthine synthase [Methanofollis formosanus]QYZ79728.1 diphthine synthase [Methanofollis formosanus]